jgi:NACalpha-BTF3-like transcription factor
MNQSGCDRETAILALKQTKGDVVEAIMKCCS